MNRELEQIAKELGLFADYKTIRVSNGEVVKVDQRINPEHKRILEAAYEAGYKAGLKEKNRGLD
jgi:hypothetical protein